MALVEPSFVPSPGPKWSLFRHLLSKKITIAIFIKSLSRHFIICKPRSREGRRAIKTVFNTSGHKFRDSQVANSFVLADWYHWKKTSPQEDAEHAFFLSVLATFPYFMTDTVHKKTMRKWSRPWKDGINKLTQIGTKQISFSFQLPNMDGNGNRLQNLATSFLPERRHIPCVNEIHYLLLSFFSFLFTLNWTPFLIKVY